MLIFQVINTLCGRCCINYKLENEVKKLLACASVFVLIATSWADITLPSIMNSKMILQRGVQVPIWGWADQGEEITVEFAGQSKKATPNAKGKWMVKLDPLEVSAENRSMNITGKNDFGSFVVFFK